MTIPAQSYLNRVTFVAGLPGCGKTTYLARMKQEGWKIFDDFKSGSHNRSSDIQAAKRLPEVIECLTAGDRVIISDIDFCDPTAQREADILFPEAGWICFAHDSATCESRLRARQRPSLEEDLTKLAHYSSIYEIPKRATVLPIGGPALKISIDYDGTLWSHMNFFRNFMWAMTNAGHLVGCVTGHNEECRQADIDLMIARGFPKPDFWFGRTSEFTSQNGAIYKSMVILREGIDIHFDDCDYGNVQTLELFRVNLGGQFYRLIIVQDRQPANVHYE